ncbi:hypothetical protein [Nocardioides rubriscoriae]|uniref:hypothetical protein n=1 Tax=Nocardioides rubriscoriae TaxID=642762 RepID=UPI0011DFB099|nr:hypothetical protein [Nocardioides rubriscoriae]
MLLPAPRPSSRSRFVTALTVLAAVATLTAGCTGGPANRPTSPSAGATPPGGADITDADFDAVARLLRVRGQGPAAR